MQTLNELRGRGINLVANALAQSTDHILGFFDMLRAELGFYVGCLNLHEQLAERASRLAFPFRARRRTLRSPHAASTTPAWPFISALGWSATTSTPTANSS